MIMLSVIFFIELILITFFVIYARSIWQKPSLLCHLSTVVSQEAGRGVNEKRTFSWKKIISEMILLSVIFW